MSREPERGCEMFPRPTGMTVGEAIARRVSCRAYPSETEAGKLPARRRKPLDEIVRWF